MTPWQAFYASVKDPSWPSCDLEQDFAQLPDWIQKECVETHGYRPGEYQSQPARLQRQFPIRTKTACQLKWTWSTVFLPLATTASCHRTNHHKFNLKQFDFHNTSAKRQDRHAMMQGQWPRQGCEYCQNIEAAGGQSDRQTNLDMPGFDYPKELDQDPRAVVVTPRILEVYFDNVCNLKCVYCGPWFSSLWQSENTRSTNQVPIYALQPWTKDSDLDVNKIRLWAWMDNNAQHLSQFHMLGGEPLYQRDLDDCINFFTRKPCPDLEFHMFSNLVTTPQRLESVLAKFKELIDNKHLRTLHVTASLDCWGAAQEYVRYPIKLDQWQKNFEHLMSHHWVKITIGSTITPLTVGTLPDLIERLNTWRTQRPIGHYFNSVTDPDYMHIDIFGDLFADDFRRAIDLCPATTPEENTKRGYLEGIAAQSASGKVDQEMVAKLLTFLDEIDARRGTSWRSTFPWLVDQKNQHVL